MNTVCAGQTKGFFFFNLLLNTMNLSKLYHNNKYYYRL